MRHLKPAILVTLWFVVCFGLAFPLAIYGFAQAFQRQATGGLVYDAKGNLIGSERIAQGFAKPEYFHPRPSAAGNGYDPTASGGTNLGPTSDKLVNGIHKKTADGKDDPSNFDGVKDLVAAYRSENGLGPTVLVPADAVTRSGSGLDPDISVENASLQAARVAKARGVQLALVKRLIVDNTSQPFLGLYGDRAVNVLKLNLALDKQGR